MRVYTSMSVQCTVPYDEDFLDTFVLKEGLMIEHFNTILITRETGDMATKRDLFTVLDERSPYFGPYHTGADMVKFVPAINTITRKCNLPDGTWLLIREEHFPAIYKRQYNLPDGTCLLTRQEHSRCTGLFMLYQIPCSGSLATMSVPPPVGTE